MGRARRVAAGLALVSTALLCVATAGGEPQPSGIDARAPGGAVTYGLVHRPITVDGNRADWQGVETNTVRGESHLWFGQGMTRENWRGNRDLSYEWQGAWHEERLFFLFQVNDDQLVRAGQSESFLCDCVELYVDFGNTGGRRVIVEDGREDWFAKCDRNELHGYEIHFLPTDPVRVYLDHAHQYAVDRPQTDEFARRWSGEALMWKTSTGYAIELGLSIPGVRLAAGKRLGVETGVCDDDGEGRKSIMMWTGTRGEFWLNMDDYGQVRLLDSDEAPSLAE